MIKFKKAMLLILFSFIFQSMITGQDNFEKFIDQNRKREKLTELEFAFLGAGIKRFPALKPISNGWGVNFRYINVNIYSNDIEYNEYLDHSSFIHRMSITDFLKIKYILRTKPLFFNLDFSPFIGVSHAPGYGEERYFFLSTGVDLEFNFLVNKKFGFSTLINVNKDLSSGNYYFNWLPIKLLIRFRNENK